MRFHYIDNRPPDIKPQHVNIIACNVIDPSSTLLLLSELVIITPAILVSVSDSFMTDIKAMRDNEAVVGWVKFQGFLIVFANKMPLSDSFGIYTANRKQMQTLNTLSHE